MWAHFVRDLTSMLHISKLLCYLRRATTDSSPKNSYSGSGRAELSSAGGLPPLD